MGRSFGEPEETVWQNNKDCQTFVPNTKVTETKTKIKERENIGHLPKFRNSDGKDSLINNTAY